MTRCGAGGRDACTESRERKQQYLCALAPAAGRTCMLSDLRTSSALLCMAWRQTQALKPADNLRVRACSRTLPCPPCRPLPMACMCPARARSCSHLGACRPACQPAAQRVGRAQKRLVPRGDAEQEGANVLRRRGGGGGLAMPATQVTSPDESVQGCWVGKKHDILLLTCAWALSR
jgi:hypothetical protein